MKSYNSKNITSINLIRPSSVQKESCVTPERRSVEQAGHAHRYVILPGQQNFSLASVGGLS